MTPTNPLPVVKSNGKPASGGKKQASDQCARLRTEIFGFIWGSATELLFDLRQVISILISISLLLNFNFIFFFNLSCKLLEESMAHYCVVMDSAEGKETGSPGLNSM